MGFPFPIPYDPNQPIPNNPFYFPETNFMHTGLGPLVIGAGFSTNYATATISSTGGGGVTDINAGFGISVSASTGSVLVTNTGVRSLTAGSNITLSSTTGDITISATGGGGGGVTSVTATAPLASSGGATPNITLANTAVTAGAYTNANITVDAQGRITAAANGSSGGSGTVTSITAGTGLSSTPAPITTSGTIDLANTTVTAGAYTYGSFTVDAQGRLTAAGSGATPVIVNDFNAKGNLLVGTADNAFTALGVGFNTNVLTADSACASGVKWATVPPPPVATPSVRGIMFGCTTDFFAGSNTGLGESVLGSNITSGTYNTAAGVNAGFWMSSGSYNTALGSSALYDANLGGESRNTAIGYFSVSCGGGSQNTAVGFCAGVCSGFNNIGGDSNTFLGFCAGTTVTSGSCNVVIGSCVVPASPTASCQLAIGYANGQNWLTGDSTKAIKPGAGIIDCAGSCGTAGQTLLSNGANAICWGIVTIADATPLAAGKIVGCTIARSLGIVGITALGVEALDTLSVAPANPNGSVAIGYRAMKLGVGPNNVAVGDCALYGPSSLGAENTAIGNFALKGAAGADGNVAIGSEAGCALTSGTYNVLLGTGVQAPSATGSCQLVIGSGPAFCWLTGDSTKAIRPGAGIIDCAGSCGTVGQILVSTGSNAICWSSASAVPDATPTLRGILYGCSGTTTTGVGCNILTLLGAGLCNTAVGCSALSSIVTGGSNTAVGYNAGSSVITAGSFNVAMGSLALGNAAGVGNISDNTAIGMCSLSALTTGTRNVAIGSCSMRLQTSGGSNVAIGYGTLFNSTGGTGNVAIGVSSLLCSSTAGFNIGVGFASMRFNTTGACNIAVGVCAHDSLDGGCNNVAIGFSAGSNLTTGCYNVAIGDSVTLPNNTGNCQLAIGYANTSYWLTGCSDGAIRPGAGIVDCTASCGTANQVLVSTGANATQWKSVNSALAVPNYGSFNSTSSQIVGTINVGQPVTLSTVAATNFSLVGGSQITAAAAGTYNIQISLQIISTGGGGGDVEVWFVKNGAPITNSNTRYSIKNANEEEVAALNLVETFAAGDNIQVYWASDNALMTLATLASTMGGPTIPSAIVTIVPVGA